MATQIQELKVPYRDRVIDENGMLSKAFQEFFKFLKIFIDPLGLEKTYDLENNIAVPTKIDGLRFNSIQVRQTFLEYFVQRVSDLSEVVEAGTIRIVFYPDAMTWALDYLAGSGPDVSGVTLTIDSATGEVYYTSTNFAGTQEKFTISVRSRSLSGRNAQ